MASAAIPLVMPSVRINQHYYGDGSVNQLSPLSAPIHLGADKILIIGLDQPRKRAHLQQMPHHPNVSTIAGHLLDSIFSDTLTADLERMQRVNKTIQTLHQHHIPSELKPVDSLLINPSTNFNQLASEHYLALPMAIRSLLRTIGIKQHSDSSLASYLLFEKSFTRRLIELGYDDGLQQIDKIMAFLQPEPR
jgi:NTE family protein